MHICTLPKVFLKTAAFQQSESDIVVITIFIDMIYDVFNIFSIVFVFKVEQYRLGVCV